MRRQRLERTASLLQDNNADAVLHSYERDGTATDAGTNGRVWTPEEMAALEQRDRDHVHLSEIHVTHGHITIRKEVGEKVKQNTTAPAVRREDSIFVRDIFAQKMRVVYTEDVLSNYLS